MARQLLLVGLVLVASLTARGFPSRGAARVCGRELVFDFVRHNGQRNVLHPGGTLVATRGGQVCVYNDGRRR